MSRIERPRVQSTETTDATTLNDTYDDYGQTAALDENNTRDAALDLQHLTNASIIVNNAQALLGNGGMLHTAPTSSLSHTTSLSSPVHHVVQTSTGTETFLNLASDPWTLTTGDVLRVFWDLSVYPTTSGTPWNNSTAKGRYSLDGTPSGSFVVTDGFHCWAAFLEWDVVDATLSNFSPVPGQSLFTQTYGSDKGQALNKTTATTLISAWTVFNLASANYGKVPSQGNYQEQGWFGTHGMYAHIETSASRTVYGIRLVLTGLLHPAHESSGDFENLLLYDINVSGTLTYKSGRISAVHMRGD
tara:strand:- start:1248 stop:2153 length:906 start_codon:yes stop_codon:yes gene_type:complete